MPCNCIEPHDGPCFGLDIPFRPGKHSMCAVCEAAHEKHQREIERIKQLPCHQCSVKQMEIDNMRQEFTEKEACGHQRNFMVGDERGVFWCTICRIEELEKHIKWWESI